MPRRIVNWGGLTARINGAARPRVAVVLCHGYGAPGDDLATLAPDVFDLAPELEDRTAFVFPAAPLLSEEFGPFGGRAWWPLNVSQLIASFADGSFRQLRELTPPGLPEAREKLYQLLQDLTSEWGIGIDQVVLGGFSQGAMLATDVALRLPLAPAALVIFSGTFISAPDWTRLAKVRTGMQVLQSHGRQDPVLPLEAALSLREMFHAAGTPLEFIEFGGGHAIPAEAMRSLAAMLERLASTPPAPARH